MPVAAAPFDLTVFLIHLTAPDSALHPNTFFFRVIYLQVLHVAMMSGDKRDAQDYFGSTSQLVKRPKPDANPNSNAVVASSSKQNGALVQAVRQDTSFTS